MQTYRHMHHGQHSRWNTQHRSLADPVYHKMPAARNPTRKPKEQAPVLEHTQSVLEKAARMLAEHTLLEKEEEVG